MNEPAVAVGSLGGTITMTKAAGESGVTPALGADELLQAVPGLAAVAQVRPHTLARVPSASLGTQDLLAALRWAASAVADGCAGVVLTQGTDTLEEAAYLLDLYWDRPEPLVITGAMRPPQQAGADGPANLLAAVTAAAAPQARDLGVLVVLNDEIHEAGRVRKTHATAVQAFTSPGSGPLGAVVEGRVLLHHRPAPRPAPLTLPAPGGLGQRVALVESCLEDRGELVRLCAREGYDAIVVSAFGVGHVTRETAEAVAEAARRVPVVVTSRTGAGTTMTGTYGYPGSERDLQDRGALMAGRLDGRKARVLLLALLGAGVDRRRLAAELALRGGLEAPDDGLPGDRPTGTA